MDGALIFVVYGKPTSQGPPILSVRTTGEHNPPSPLSHDHANGTEFQTVYSNWTQTGDVYRATVNLICYNCTRWNTVDVNNKAQPWIAAYNPTQRFEVHSEDASLEMHSKERDSGYGFFFTDMPLSLTKSYTPPGFPPVSETYSSFGAAEEADGVAATASTHDSGFRHRAWQVHGLLLTIAYLGIYPLGVLLLRRQSVNAFKLHWISQVCASILTALGILLGIYLHPEIEHLHQLIGLVVGFAPVVQILLGWRHHIIYLRIGRATMLSEIHVTLGRVILCLGAVNILLGMYLKQWSAWLMIVVALVIAAEAVGLFFVLRSSRGLQSQQKYAHLNEDDLDGAFALEDVESMSDDEDEYTEKRRGSLPMSSHTRPEK
ncbi:MAG: hypothetical protein Q9159_005106 [Coniocarpon cinnabarinum]